MTNINSQVVFTEETPVRVGRPAEEPTEAIEALQRHFATRPAIASARLGLMEVNPNRPGSYFTYTIGITCLRAQDLEAEESAAIEALMTISTGRWPISFVPSNATYFSSECRTFFQKESSQPKRGFFSRLFGK